MRRGWKGILNKHGKDSYEEAQIRRWVRANFAQPLRKAFDDRQANLITEEEYEKKLDSLIFTYKELQGDLHATNPQDGWHAYDSQKRVYYPKYTIAVGFFSKERDKFHEALQIIKTTEEYKKIREKNDPEELFTCVALNCLDREIYPLIADTPGPYHEGEIKLLRRQDFLEVTQMRMNYTVKEQKNIIERAGTIDKEIPVIGELKPQELEDGGLFVLPPARDCEICGKTFDNQSDLVDHHNEEHSD